MHDLWRSIITHTTIPSTFDGNIPEFVFSNNEQRLLIGEKYIVNDSEGNEQEVELLSATVDEKNKKANALCRNNRGQVHIIQFSLTDSEISAYKQSPDTFFGIYHEQGKRVDSPIEFFDFCMKSHKSLTKENLLERLKMYPNQSILLSKSKDELLEIYCEAFNK